MLVTESRIWAENYKKHGSTAQYSIWHCVMMLAEFEEVKIDIKNFDEKDIVKGEKDFYDFMKTFYQDMYTNPAQYAIPTVEYDDYMKSIDIDSVSADPHKRDARESKLRNRFQQAIQFYSDFFWEIGLAADEICNKNYELVLSKMKYDNVLTSLDRPYIKEENERRLNALVDRGIVIKETNKKVTISCGQYSKMFLGLQVLLSAPESKSKRLNYLRLDYRGYYRAVPEIRDVMMTLDKGHCDILNVLLPLFINSKTRCALYPMSNITSSSKNDNKWKVDYFRNSQRVFGFYAGPAFLSIGILFRTPENLIRIIKILEENDPELLEWFCEQFKEVFHDCPRNKAIMFGNRKKHLCCGSSGGKMEIINPAKSDVKKCMRLIKMI